MENLFNEYIDVNDKGLRNTIFLSFSCLVAWLILPVIESRFKLLSKIVNNNKAKAADFLAYGLIHLGSFRNYAFISTIWNSKQLELNELNLVCQVAGVILGLLSIVIFICASTKLGLRGMYFGDCFGFLLKEKVYAFPFNIVSHPQYWSILGMALSFSLFFRSPVGLFLTVLNAFSFLLLAFFENLELKRIYKN